MQFVIRFDHLYLQLQGRKINDGDVTTCLDVKPISEYESANNQKEGTEERRERERNNELKSRIRRRKHRNAVALRRLFTVEGSNVWRGWAKGRLLRPQITEDQRTIPRGTLSKSVPNSTSVDRTATRPTTSSWRRVAILSTVGPPCSSRLWRDIAERGPRPESTISFAPRL